MIFKWLNKTPAHKTHKTHKKILIITSSAGYGHIQAADAYIEKERILNPNTKIIKKDILIDLFNKPFGSLCVYFWNTSQKHGYIKALMLFQKNVPIADVLFSPFIFIQTLILLIREDIDQVIDTQPVGTAALIKALQIAQKIQKKHLKLEKILTELPTENTIQFFKPIKLLSKKDKHSLQLISTYPLLKDHQTAAHFWHCHCGLSESHITYESSALRTPFKTSFLHTQSQQPINIHIETHSKDEHQLIIRAIQHGNLTPISQYPFIEVSIKPTYKISTILLGSNPTQKATLQYVHNIIDLISNTTSITQHVVFVFCYSYQKKKSNLLQQVCDLNAKYASQLNTLTIVPMCFQPASTIAALYRRSNATLTRSGGLTSMELLSSSQGKIWIHAQNQTTTSQNLLPHKKYGMPIWERGNAIYLQQKKGAIIINPSSFNQLCRSFFQ